MANNQNDKASCQSHLDLASVASVDTVDTVDTVGTVASVGTVDTVGSLESVENECGLTTTHISLLSLSTCTGCKALY